MSFTFYIVYTVHALDSIYYVICKYNILNKYETCKYNVICKYILNKYVIFKYVNNVNVNPITHMGSCRNPFTLLDTVCKEQFWFVQERIKADFSIICDQVCKNPTCFAVSRFTLYDNKMKIKPHMQKFMGNLTEFTE